MFVEKNAKISSVKTERTLDPEAPRSALIPASVPLTMVSACVCARVGVGVRACWRDGALKARVRVCRRDGGRHVRDVGRRF